MIAVVLAFAALGALVGWPLGATLLWRATARAAPGHCGVCAYDMTGVNEEAPCPECGTPRAAAAIAIPPGAMRQGLRVGLLMEVCAFLVIPVAYIPMYWTTAPIIAWVLVYTACGWLVLIRICKRMQQADRVATIAMYIAYYGALLVLFGSISIFMLDTIGVPEWALVVAVAHMAAFALTGWMLVWQGVNMANERREAIAQASGTASSCEECPASAGSPPEPARRGGRE